MIINRSQITFQFNIVSSAKYLMDPSGNSHVNRWADFGKHPKGKLDIAIRIFLKIIHTNSFSQLANPNNCSKDTFPDQLIQFLGLQGLRFPNAHRFLIPWLVRGLKTILIETVTLKLIFNKKYFPLWQVLGFH